jgi:hypothetical protein
MYPMIEGSTMEQYTDANGKSYWVNRPEAICSIIMRSHTLYGDSLSWTDDSESIMNIGNTTISMSFTLN